MSYICVSVTTIVCLVYQGANRVSIHTDSQNLINSVTTWIYKWLANGWVKSNGKPIIHKLQYQELLCAMEDLDVKWVCCIMF